jgi:hypothetical protein
VRGNESLCTLGEQFVFAKIGRERKKGERERGREEEREKG